MITNDSQMQQIFADVGMMSLKHVRDINDAFGQLAACQREKQAVLDQMAISSRDHQAHVARIRTERDTLADQVVVLTQKVTKLQRKMAQHRRRSSRAVVSRNARIAELEAVVITA